MTCSCSLRERADRPNAWNDNLPLLGDFNLDGLDDPPYQAFVSTGPFPPAEVTGISRTIFDNENIHHYLRPDRLGLASTPAGTPWLKSLSDSHHGGSFDFVPYAFTDLSKTEVSWRISDH